MDQSLPNWRALVVVGLGILVLAITLPLTGHVPLGGALLLYGTSFAVLFKGVAMRRRGQRAHGGA